MAAVDNNIDTRQVVLVTGCSTGIGRALAIELSQHGDGTAFRVFASARDPESLRTLSPQIDRIQIDVTDDSSTKKAIDSIISQVGRIDILINNAGANTAIGPAVEVDLDRYRSTFEVNYFGLIRITSEVSRHMISRRSGRIINIGSVAGLVPLPYAAAYASSKAAVHAYSEALRMELAGFGIQVSIVSPGAIKSQIGDNGAKNIVMAKDSNYRSVHDMLTFRANYSQVGRPAPTPAADFAKEIIHKVVVPSYAPVYFVSGSRSFGVSVLFYFPVWIRMWLIGRVFQMGRVGKP